MEYMSKVTNELLTANICNYFKKVGTNHTRVTRAVTNQDLILPTLHLETSKRDIGYRGPLYWNLVDNEIKGAQNLAVFKNWLRNSDMFIYE